MIKLKEPFNWKGEILEVGTVIGLGELEEKMIASGAAERYTPDQAEKQGPSEEDFRGLLDAYEKSQEAIADLRKEIAERDEVIADLQKPVETAKAEVQEVQEENEPVKVEEAPKEAEPLAQEKPKVGRTK